MVWFKRIGIGLLAVLVVAVSILYGASQVVIGTKRDVPLIAFRAATLPAAIAEGKRIAAIAQCSDCHGAAGKGRVLEDSFLVGRLAPPGLARKAALYSDAELERLIRHGVKRDGSTLWVMPAQNFAHLSNADVANVIGWIRTLKPAPDDQVAPTQFGPLARLAVLGGGLKPSFVAARIPPSTDRGQYLVEVACQQCHLLHASRPSDSSDQIVPPLAMVAAAYDLPTFRRLLHSGQGVSPRDLGAMRLAVLGGLDKLHDDEIAAIHAYLVVESSKSGAQ